MLETDPFKLVTFYWLFNTTNTSGRNFKRFLQVFFFFFSKTGSYENRMETL